MSSLDVNGVSLFCEQKGSGGDPVVFVHGTMCDYRIWRAQTDAVSKSYRTVTYSRRYAYPNNRPGDVMDSTVENNAADLAALVDKLGITPVHLVGHSYGGFVAAYLATQHPQMLRSLTLDNAAIATMVVSNPNDPLQLLSLLLRSPPVASSARRLLNETRSSIRATDAGRTDEAANIFYAGLFDKGVTLPNLLEEYRKIMIDNAKTLRETTTRFPKLTAVETSAIRTSTMVIRGELSARWDLEISKRLAAAIPGSESIKVSAGGHFCMVENPSEFNTKLLGFLAKQH